MPRSGGSSYFLGPITLIDRAQFRDEWEREYDSKPLKQNPLGKGVTSSDFPNHPYFRTSTDGKIPGSKRCARVSFSNEPEPDMKAAGVRCLMERYVAGVNVGVVVLVDHPAPNLTVITVIDIKKG